MFDTTHSILIKRKIKALYPDVQIDDGFVLRVYFSLFLLEHPEISEERDNPIFLKMDKDNATVRDLKDILLCFDCPELFSLIIPSCISDGDGSFRQYYKRFVRNKGNKKKLEFLLSVYIIKEAFNSGFLVGFTSTWDEKEKEFLASYNASVEDLSKDGFNLKYSALDFDKILLSIFAYRFESESLETIRSLAEDDVIECGKLSKTLKNNLKLSLENQYRICSDFYYKPEDEGDESSAVISEKNTDDLTDENSPSQFTQFREKKERRREFQVVANALRRCRPLSILSALYFMRPGGGMNHDTNMGWEKLFVRKYFLPQVRIQKTKPVLIMFPTPELVMDWIDRDEEFETVFVFEYEAMFGILNKEYQNSNKKNYRFIGLDLLKSVVEKNHAEGRAFHNVLILSPTKAGNMEYQLKDLIKHQCNPDANIYVLDSEHSFKREDAFTSSVMEDGDYQISDILMLPRNVGFGQGARQQCFFKAGRKNGDDNDQTNFKLLRHLSKNSKDSFGTVTEVNYLIGEKELCDSISLRAFAESDNTSLRRHLFEPVPGGKTGKERSPAKSVHITDEIIAWYTSNTYVAALGQVVLKIYICEAPSENPNRMFEKVRGKRVKDSIKEKVCFCYEIEKYIREEYPEEELTKRNVGNGESSIRRIKDVIISTYSERLSGKMISLRTLLFLYPEVLANFSDEAKGIVSLLLKTALANGKLDSYPFEFFDDIASALSERENGVPRLACLGVISNIIDAAIKLNHCSRNVIDEELSDRAESKKTQAKAFRSVRDALTKKSLTTVEFVKLATMLGNLSASDAGCLGLLIKLFTGLSDNELCALKWKDFLKVEGYGFYVLQIYKQMKSNGEDVTGFNSLEDYRVIPCSPFLAEVLCAQREALLNREEAPVLEDLYILADNETGALLTPRRMLDKRKEMLAKLDITDISLFLPYDNNSGKESNISRYQGDLFRENIRYWAITKGMFNEDEMAYFLGNVRSTTFGIYYCDYLNDASQFILFSKLKRMEVAIRRGRQGVLLRTMKLGGESVVLKAPKSSFPLEVDVVVKTDGSTQQKVSVKVDSVYGIRSQVAKGKENV